MFIKKLNELIENLNLEMENLKIKMNETLNKPEGINQNTIKLISEIEVLKKKMAIFSQEVNLKTEQNNKYVSELKLKCYNYQLQIENLKHLESLKIEKLKNEISQNFIIIGHLENKDISKINLFELNQKDNFNLEDDHVSIIIIENESLKKKIKNLEMEVKKVQNIEKLQFKLKKKKEKIEKVEQKNTTLEFETVNLKEMAKRKNWTTSNFRRKNSGLQKNGKTIYFESTKDF